MVRRHLPGSANSVSPMNAVKPTFRPVARLCALALALAASIPHVVLAYDSDDHSGKSRLQYQKEEEIRNMQRREEEARHRIARNRERGDAELSEIRDLLKQCRTIVDATTERAKSVLKKTGEPLPPDLRKFGQQCTRRISALEESMTECEEKLHSSDFVSEIVVASIQALRHEATLALADAQRLSATMAQFDATITGGATADPDRDRMREEQLRQAVLRKKRLIAAISVSAAVLALAVGVAVSVSKRKKQSATTVSRGPLRPVHPLPK